MWYSTKRLEKQSRAFQARTGNMPPGMREAELHAEMERGWQEIEDTVRSFRVGDAILEGGRFDTLSLGTWMSIVQAADLTYVPIVMVGKAELIPALREGAPIRLQVPDEVLPYRGMVRLDCCGTSKLKLEMSVRGERVHQQIIGAVRDAEGWAFELDERTVHGLMEYVGQIEGYGEIACPIWWRPWVKAIDVEVPRPSFMGKHADRDTWPLEWRAIVQRGRLVALSAYYIQAAVSKTALIDEHVASIVTQVAMLLQFMTDRGIQPWHPRYIGDVATDDLSFTCDFISTPSGPAFLEAGPRVPVDETNTPVMEWGAHPCCFMGREVRGLALARDLPSIPLPSHTGEA